MHFVKKIIFFLILFLLLHPPINAISPENLIITEIMKNPDSVNDNQGEWFEVYNSTDQSIDLRGLKIKDNDTDQFIIEDESPILIEPFSYFVLGCNNDSITNGNLKIDYQYPYYLESSFRFQLADAADEIIILNNETEIDRVEYTTPDWPNPKGASIILLEPTLPNEIAANWTTATTLYGDGDLGTPGQPNFPSLTPILTPTPTEIPTSTPSPTLVPTTIPTTTLTPTTSPIPTPSPTSCLFCTKYQEFFRQTFRNLFSRLFRLPLSRN